eukprot:gnl/TRDRNA2_/TRDRNA2_175114_c1_seq2.p1 gnl/TRDRNA2_/TRDRNA2_175114_c1~~gnl/TRDRNA2_/TRDRNA2_175114_c1_seq2.p1  ORF type:complete len:575 (-),score=94.95 gnl/TRDRNA2_/TRDRNA2_175114_c1_seq2:491-2152(-)
MGAAIGAAYFESLDLGVRGTIRKCNEAHLAMLNSVYDRVKALLVALQSEDFSESHQTIMRGIAPASRELAETVQVLLMAVTEAICDGDIDGGEKESLRAKVKDVTYAVARLSQDFDTVRRTFNSSVHPELLGESFFVLALSAYARLVCDFTTDVLDKPLPQGNLMGDFANCIKSTWSIADMTEKYHMNFAVRYFVAILIGIVYVIEECNWVGTTAIVIVFLMNTNQCPDVQGNLNGLIAVVCANLLGCIAFDHACMTGLGDYVLPACAFVFWLGCLYAYWSGGKFATLGVLAAGLGAPRFIAHCPESGSTSAGAAGLYNALINIFFSIAIVSFCEVAFAADRASTLALDALNDAFRNVQKGFEAFWNEQDISAAIAPVAGLCSKGDSFNTSANIEPRFWRIDWKFYMYQDLVESLRKLRLDLLMMEQALLGSTKNSEGLFSKFADKKEWGRIRQDLDSTLEQARHLSIGLQGLEIGTFEELQSQVDFESENKLDELEDLPALLQALAATLKFPASAPASMEDDDICKVAVVLTMLQASCAHIAHIIHVLINNA